MRNSFSYHEFFAFLLFRDAKDRRHVIKRKETGKRSQCFNKNKQTEKIVGRENRWLSISQILREVLHLLEKKGKNRHKEGFGTAYCLAESTVIQMQK